MRIKLLEKAFLASFLVCSTQTAAQSIDDYLKDQATLFDATPKAQRYNLITQPVLCHMNEVESYDGLENGSTSFYDSSKGRYYDIHNTLTLAVSFGLSNLVEKFLSCVKDINDKETLSWGYRQPYNLFHLALDPKSNLNESAVYDEFEKTKNSLTLKKLLKIVDLIGQKNHGNTAFVNATLHPSTTHYRNYTNPPLAAGEPSGQYYAYQNALRARGMLYGADPLVKGSSFYGLNVEKSTALKEYLFQYYIELTKKGIFLYPTQHVKDVIEKRALENNYDLSKLEELVKTRSQLQNQLKTFESKMKNEKSSNKRHLLDICGEIKNDLKQVERAILKM